MTTDKVSEDGQQGVVKGRLASIDALRGFDMFWIIGAGTVFASLDGIFKSPTTGFIARQLEHVKWEGFRFEDLIFPLFLFIVGTVMPFSISRRVERGQSRRALYLHIFKRAGVLILLGLILNGLLRFNWPEMHWPGVLQRIGLCYFFAALLVMNTKWRTQLIVAIAILLLYWAATTLIPVPGYGAGVITPEGCLSSYIDQNLLPGRIHEEYYGYGDNEGIISTLPAICTTLFGALAGHWLRSKHSGNRKAAALAIAGIICVFAGYIWGASFPVIKNIWTSSYVLVSAGYSLLLLALFYWVIDVKGYKKWAFFFIVIGMNAITIYYIQWIVSFDTVAAFFVDGIAQWAGSAKPLILACGTLAVKWLLLLFLYQRRIFLKI
ncbi:MAG: acyltransferase family protein [Planctomycetota bacterium]|jgi:predicted acyltransferase